MHSFTIISLAALAALTAAAPHANKHALHHRSLEPATIFERGSDGSCGANSGSCGPGFCCSAYGYCGTSAAYCAAGCQSAFGTCNGVSTTASTIAPSSTKTTTVTSASTTFATSTFTSTTASSAAAATSTASSSNSGSDSYKVYSGVGTVAAGWPAMSAWVDFDSMWTANMAYISISCTQFGEPNNSDQESADLKTAIQSIASSSSIDQRFILAIVMQESKGCVRAPTTNGGVVNPGLMQDHDGTGSCNNAATVGVLNPCPSSEITQMIQDGTTGTASGDGLQQCLSESGASDVSKYYKAARIYNSGSIAASGNLQDGVATHCYSSDVANRLTGWVKAASTCTY